MSDDSSCSGSPSTQPSLSEYDNSSCDEDEYETNSEPEVESGSESGSQNLPRNNEREMYDDDDIDEDGDNDNEVWIQSVQISVTMIATMTGLHKNMTKPVQSQVIIVILNQKTQT